MKKTLFAAAVLFSFATVAIAAPVKMNDDQLALTAAGDRRDSQGVSVHGGCTAFCTVGAGAGASDGSGNLSGNIVTVVVVDVKASFGGRGR